MKRFTAGTYLLITASLGTISLVLLDVNIADFQKIIVILLIVLLLLSGKPASSVKETNYSKNIKRALLFISTLFIQLIVLSTGNVKSPFLVLIHLFTLGVGFWAGIGNGFLFLGLTLVALLLNIHINEGIKEFFVEDPGSLLLYMVSFLVILPLSVLLTRYYYLKDTIVNVLTKEIKTRESEQQSLYQGLNELILVTDRDLNILSANEAASKILSIPKNGITKKVIFDIVILKNKENALINKDSISLDKVIYEREPLLFENLTLFTKNTPVPKEVNMQIRPVISIGNVVDQLTFVISDRHKPLIGGAEGHQNLDKAKVRHQAMFADLKKKLSERGLPDLKTKAELLERSENDVLISMEIEDHYIEQVKTDTDIAELCKRRIHHELELAEDLKVGINFNLPNFEGKDISHLISKDSSIAPVILTSPFYSVKIDNKWFDFLIMKLLDIAILLESSTDKAQVDFTIDRQGNSGWVITIKTNYPGITSESYPLLLTKYYGILGAATKLNLSSGLEGYIASTIAKFLNVDLRVDRIEGVPGFAFKLRVNKE